MQNKRKILRAANFAVAALLSALFFAGISYQTYIYFTSESGKGRIIRNSFRWLFPG